MAGDELKRIDRNAAAASKALTEAASSIERLSRLGSETTKKVGGITNAFGDLEKSALGVSSALKGGVTAVTSILSASKAVGPLFEGLGKGIGFSIDALETFIGVSGDALEMAFNLFDAPSRDIRSFADGVFDLNKRFGGTIEQAFVFADVMKAETMSPFARALHLTRDEIIAFANATGRTNITLEQQGKIVDTGIGRTNLLAATMALASASSLSATEGAGLLNTALNKQGKSAQDALEIMGLFTGVARETGLSIDDVSSNLNSAVSNFTKLGISADFGVPLLQGFARVMMDMGLGIENATDLTTGLSRALASLTTDYANAYIVFQRGGLEMGGSGGGGALGASIGLQAEVLKADRTGDQSELATQLAKGMRDTLASFTGGEIITVGQASESPELQTQFYTQQQLLQNQFGIKDAASANRTLELLAQIDDATRAGDLDAKASLEEALRKEKEGRDLTLDEFEKANRHLAAHSNLLAVIARPTLMKQRGGAEMLRKSFVDPAIDRAAKAAEDGAVAYDKQITNILAWAGAAADKFGLSDPGTDPAMAAAAGAGGARPSKTGPDSLSANTDIVMLAAETAATAASLAAINEAGFVNKDDFIAALAAAMTQSLNDNLSIKVSLTEEAKQQVAVIASLQKQIQ